MDQVLAQKHYMQVPMGAFIRLSFLNDSYHLFYSIVQIKNDLKRFKIVRSCFFVRFKKRQTFQFSERFKSFVRRSIFSKRHNHSGVITLVVIDGEFFDKLNFWSRDFRPIGRLENRFVIFSVQQEGSISNLENGGKKFRPIGSRLLQRRHLIRFYTQEDDF